jgi:hypothetical protein
MAIEGRVVDIAALSEQDAIVLDQEYVHVDEVPVGQPGRLRCVVSGLWEARIAGPSGVFSHDRGHDHADILPNSG